MAIVCPFIITASLYFLDKLAALSNVLVKQTKVSVVDVCGMHLVFKASSNYRSKLLPSNSCGKLVPVKVMLSAPSTFKSE